MMWSKAVGCGDTASAAVILGDPDPEHAQATGRQLSGFDYAVWERRRFDVVVAGNRAKFGQHAELRNFLLSTQEKVLVEASADDQIWGIGLGEEEARAMDPRGWPGLNLLGRALMRVRDELRSS